MKNIKSGLMVSLLLFAILQSVFTASAAELAIQSSILHPKGLLWKIEKQGQPISFLFGTMHVNDLSVTKLPEAVEKAFLRSEHFVMEVVMDSAAVQYITRVSFLEKGNSLRGIMGDTEYDRLLGLLKNRLPIPEKTLNTMKPWAVLMILMAPVESQGGADNLLDISLYRRAVKNNLKVSGLESAEEQISVFESMSLQDQLWMLSRSIEDIEHMDAQYPDMLQAYIKGDLSELVEIQKAAMYDDSDIDDKFVYQLLDVRNVRMANRMQSILKQGKAFIAIGALHLPGEAGVLHLLEQQGYNVSPVY